MAVQLIDGEVLLVDDEVADDPACCCGACCAGEVCSITTAAGCTGIGGVFQGVNTPCDPNPCAALPPCSGCEMPDFVTGTTHYLVRTLHLTENKTVTGPDGFVCNESSNFTTTLNDVDCADAFTCVGSIHWDSSDPPHSIDESWVAGGFGCIRSPLDTIPGCLGACQGIVNAVPPWPSHGGDWVVNPALATLHQSDSDSNPEGYSWSCTADWTDTLSIQCE